MWPRGGAPWAGAAWSRRGCAGGSRRAGGRGAVAPGGGRGGGLGGGGGGVGRAALRRALEAAGGQVRCGAVVAAVECHGGRVGGVRLSDGTEVTAPLVVSACDPRETFVSWLSRPPASAAATVERWRHAPRRDG